MLVGPNGKEHNFTSPLEKNIGKLIVLKLGLAVGGN